MANVSEGKGSSSQAAAAAVSGWRDVEPKDVAPKGCGLRRNPRYVSGETFSIVDDGGDDGPRIEGYPDIPVCRCPGGCGGFRFQVDAVAKCAGRATCFYQRTVFLENLVRRSRYVERCPYCSKVYVKSSARQSSVPDVCGSAECETRWCSENAGTCACIVCGTPCATMVSLTTGILPHLYPTALFVSDSFWVCPGPCKLALRRAADEEVRSIGKRLIDGDSVSCKDDPSRAGVTPEIRSAIEGWLRKIPQ